ncbi:MAG: hypothetical protein ACTSVI_15620 [Promethearchaeota archaeon]
MPCVTASFSGNGWDLLLRTNMRIGNKINENGEKKIFRNALTPIS